MATSHLSLIIPVYNRPNEVEELLDSLTRQSETNFEVVIVEDGSKETCEHVVDAFKDKLAISYYYIPNGGPGNARNYGAKQSKGDYLIVLDSDCILPPRLHQIGKQRIAGNRGGRFRRTGQGLRQLYGCSKSHQLLHDFLLHHRRHPGRQEENGQVLSSQLQYGNP